MGLSYVSSFPIYRSIVLPVACRVSSKDFIKGGRSKPKQYVIPTTMITDIAEETHTNHDHQLSGRNVGTPTSCFSQTLAAWSFSLPLERIAPTRDETLRVPAWEAISHMADHSVGARDELHESEVSQDDAKDRKRKMLPR